MLMVIKHSYKLTLTYKKIKVKKIIFHKIFLHKFNTDFLKIVYQKKFY
jgi:hypothetical protein